MGNDQHTGIFTSLLIYIYIYIYTHPVFVINSIYVLIAAGMCYEHDARCMNFCDNCIQLVKHSHSWNMIAIQIYDFHAFPIPFHFQHNRNREKKSRFSLSFDCFFYYSLFPLLCCFYFNSAFFFIFSDVPDRRCWAMSTSTTSSAKSTG